MKNLPSYQRVKYFRQKFLCENPWVSPQTVDANNALLVTSSFSLLKSRQVRGGAYRCLQSAKLTSQMAERHNLPRSRHQILQSCSQTTLKVRLTFIGRCIANIFAQHNQQYATFHNLFISVRRSTCFRRGFLPSSAAQNCTYRVRALLLPAASLARLAAGSSNGLTLYVQF